MENDEDSFSTGLQVFYHTLEDVGVVSYKTKCGVAVVAENTPYLICAVAVVNTFLG